MTHGQTPAQTIGPFHSILQPLAGAELVAAGDPDALVIEGTVYDGAGAPVTDALIEIWQANRHGRYAHPADTRELIAEPGFTGFGRCATDSSGTYRFITVKPAFVEGEPAPHINLIIHARGLLIHLTTRLYFPDEPANASDPLLQSIIDPAIRETLIARARGPRRLRFDIRLQGEGETAFLAI